MTSHYYAIADAGGNVYPGTFSRDKVASKCLHIAGDARSWSIPCGDDTTDVDSRYWDPYAARGDHVVHCTVETNEQVKVTAARL